MQRRWNHIVGRLTHVYVVIGMHGNTRPYFTTHELDCPIRYHLIRIHVR